MKLFFDTETSGLADYSMPAGHPSQPRLVQLGVVLSTDECDEVSHAKILVKPDGWTISPGAQETHGISTEHALKYGVPVMAALSIFFQMAAVAKQSIAFNHDFDALIIQGEFTHTKFACPLGRPALESVCEMKAMTPVCQILKPQWQIDKYGEADKYKFPNLQEAHEKAFGRKFDKGHDALADVRAMLAVHRWRIALPQRDLGI